MSFAPSSGIRLRSPFCHSSWPPLEATVGFFYHPRCLMETSLSQCFPALCENSADWV